MEQINGTDVEQIFGLNYPFQYINSLILIGFKLPMFKQKAFQEYCNQMAIGYYLVRSLSDFKAIIGTL